MAVTHVVRSADVTVADWRRAVPEVTHRRAARRALKGAKAELPARLLRPGDRAGALRAGIGYIPEDRQADVFVPLLGAAENIVMTSTDRIARFGFVGPRRREAWAAPLARRLSLVSAGLGQPVRELSGGNRPAAWTWPPRNCCSPSSTGSPPKPARACCWPVS